MGKLKEIKVFAIGSTSQEQNFPKKWRDNDKTSSNLLMCTVVLLQLSNKVVVEAVVYFGMSTSDIDIGPMVMVIHN